MGFDPMCVTTKRILRNLGGDKISGKTLTFDGNLEGRNVIDSEFGKIVKISDDVCNFDAAISINYIHGDRTGSSNGFEVQTSDGISGVAIDGTIYAVRFDENYEELCGTYFLYHSDTHYATSIEFAETIHPIDPKFLPGVTIDLDSYNITDEAGNAMTLGNYLLAKVGAGGGFGMVLGLAKFWEDLNTDSPVTLTQSYGDFNIKIDGVTTAKMLSSGYSAQLSYSMLMVTETLAAMDISVVLARNADNAYAVVKVTPLS